MAHLARVLAMKRVVCTPLKRTRGFWASSGDVKALTAMIDTKLSSIEAKVGALDAKVGALEVKVGALEVKVGALDAKIGDVEKKVDRVSADALHKSDVWQALAAFAGLLTVAANFTTTANGWSAKETGSSK